MTYRRAGFLAHGSPVAFVGNVRFLAGRSPDTTLAVFAASLANTTLSFRRTTTGFEASYQVELQFSLAGGNHGLSSTETIRVGGYQETQRADESVIFQKVVSLPPGSGWVGVTVRDLNTGGFSRDSEALDVPRFDRGPVLSSIIPVYQVQERAGRTSPPELVLNPRSSVPFGTDTLRVYIEGYGLDSGTAVQVRALDEAGVQVWISTAALVGTRDVAAALVFVDPAVLPVGELRLEATLGSRDTVRAPVFVGVSDVWVVANLDDVLSLLRYFGFADRIRTLRAASAAERPALWREFWRETDPNPVTPENEAMIEYFARIEVANQKYREGSDPGWLTDRGEVFINIGEPDDVFDQSSGLQGSRRSIRWTYNAERLVLDFVDDMGFGRFRLTPSSRSDYQMVLTRSRRP